VSTYTRREWLALSLAGAAAAAAPAWAAPAAKSKGCTLSIGTYSLKGMPLEEGVKLVATTGYDAIEIATQPGCDGEPAKLAPRRRKDVRAQLEGTGLKLTSLMEHLPPTSDDRQHKADLDRLRRVVDLGRDLSPNHLPLLQTVLGGGDWEKKKSLYRDRVGDWLRLAQESRMVFGIKPHRGGGMSRPSEAIWLIQQLGNSPWLRMVYDYSHYAYRDMPLEETVREALPYTAHLVVKDAVEQNGKVVFALPGESGTFDYAKLLRLFYDGGYRADVCCEVSSMVSSKPGYDAAAAAKTCYRNMAQAFAKSGIVRG
jgi:sugar phosphate isomerase/epimerase